MTEEPKKGGGWKQRSRFRQEPEKAKPIKLQDRDIEILSALHQYRYVTTRGLLRLFAPDGVGERSLRRRLMQLFHAQLVMRRYVYPDDLTPGFGSTQAIYILDKAGGTELKKRGLVEAGVADVIRRRGRIGKREIEHTLGISEFQLVLSMAIDGHPEYRLEWFVSDHESTANKIRVRTRRYRVKWDRKTNSDIVEALGGGQQTRTIWPDGTFLVSRGDERFLFFLEIDRASRDRQRLFDRALRYHQYVTQHRDRVLKDRGFNSEEPVHVFVLFVAPSLDRVHSLIEASNAVPEIRRNRPPFWFLSQENIDLEHPQRLLSDKVTLGLSSAPGFLLAP
jgi:hypothetical protein